MYEMLVGHPPFYDDEPFLIYEKILESTIKFPKFLND
jgi:protein kinase A